MHPWLFHIGDFGIPSYWVFFVLGFSAAVFLAWRKASQEEIAPNKILDLSLLIILAAVVGARLLYVFTAEDVLQNNRPLLGHYLENPVEIFWVWNGLTFFGGLLLALPLAIWYLRHYQLPVGRVLDIFGLVIPLGLVFGRLGCLFAGCCHGQPTQAPWGMIFTHPHSLARPLNVALHPTQLYSLICMLVLFVAMWVLYHKIKKFDGQVFLSFLVLYSACRFLIEFFRADNRGLFFGRYLSTSQVLALPIVFIALALLIILGHRERIKIHS
jgi:phosphatidylglycerol:prolipoprotein diacylglycerol transferase